MSGRRGDLRLTFLQQTACGGFSGMLARTVTAPLDVVKIRTQVGTYDTKSGIRNSFATLYRDGGYKAFWRGNMIGCLRLVPFSVVHVAAFYRLKMYLADPCGRLSGWTALVAGGGAGLIANLLLYPTDTIKTRLIVQTPGKLTYTGITDACRSMIAEEGFLSFYRGITTPILGAVPFTAAMFLTYETLDDLSKSHNAPQSAFRGFFNGCIAALVAQTVSFPFDTIRKKMQAQGDVFPSHGYVDVTFDGALDAFKKTVRYHGVASLWKGGLANALRILPYSGIMFMSYESLKKSCLFYNGYTVSFLPHLDDPHPYIDQSFRPDELDDFFEEVHFSGSPWDEEDISG